MDFFAISLQLSIKIGTVIFPLDITTLTNEIAKLGYSPAILGKKTQEGVPIQQGDLAIKGNIILNANKQAMTVSLVGSNPKEMASAFEELIPCLTKSNVNLEKDVQAYGINATYEIVSGKNALDTIAKFYGSDSSLKKLDSSLGLESSFLTIGLRRNDPDMKSSKYHFIRIEPTLARFGKSYYVSFIQRDKEQKIVLDILRNLEDKLSAAINEIEK